MRPAVALLFVVACAASTPAPRALPATASATQRYLGDRTTRRRALEDELVNPANEYSRLRLDHYATGKSGDWDELPEYNPKAAPWTTPQAALAPLVISAAARAGDPDALRALGEAAFDHYPTQTAVAAERVVTDVESAKRFGFWIDGGRVGGLVRVETPDGVAHLAYSCATCHSGVRNGKLVRGVPSDTLDIGAMTVQVFRGAHEDALLAWGPGRVDVTTDAGDEPVRIPDLRAIRDLAFLHHTASVVQRDVVSLAIRVETLIITSNSQAIRPPREIALGLAMYLWSLEATIPKRDAASEAEKHGAALFTTHCANCHAPPGYSGKPVALAEIGTDGHLGASLNRGTGTYRVPTLRGIATRGPLLHDASISTPADLLDPARLQPGWPNRRPGSGTGPVFGHRYGLLLTREERADLGAFLQTL